MELSIAGSDKFYNDLIEDLEKSWQEEIAINPNYDFYNDHNYEKCEKCFYENELSEFTGEEMNHILKLMGY